MDTEWRRLGPVAEFDQLSAIYQAICGKLLWFWLPTKDKGLVRARTKLMGAPLHLMGFDHDFKRYIEQNPKTQTDAARRVREGARIVWVIDTTTKEYIGRIEDGTVYMR